MKLQKPYFTDCYLLIVLDLCCPVSSLVNNLSEGIHKFEWKYGHDNRKCKTHGIKYRDCKCCLEYTRVKYGLKKI